MALDWFKIAKTGYEKGYYDTNDLKTLVKKGRITEEQYTEICGEEYSE